MEIYSKYYSTGTSGNQQRNCSTEIMQTFHLIPKSSPLCCHCHCFELTYVCHHPSHSQWIDENPLRMCTLKWNVSSNSVGVSLKQCHSTKGKKSLSPPWALFTEFQTLQIPFSVANLTLTSPSPPDLYCSADCRRASPSHRYYQLHVAHLYSTVAVCLVTSWQFHSPKSSLNFFLYLTVIRTH